MRSLGIDLDSVRAVEVEPGLGNGGLGRLAACYIDSLATLQIPAVGYGIRYEYGIFRQTFVDGNQVEQPDSWLQNGSPWEFPHPEMRVKVRFAGHTEQYEDEDGEHPDALGPRLGGQRDPVQLHGSRVPTGNVNTLRLWSARATQAFDLEVFNNGDYLQAVRSQAFAENISKVLYPEDSTPQGKELRLQQQYFFVACSLRDYIDNTLPRGFDLRRLPERVIFQLNDTHPVIAIPELMRILVDEQRHRLGRGLGHLPASVSPTPATRCCPRRWRSGRSSCWAGCCPGTWRSSTGSTRNSWSSCGRPTPTTSSGSGGCRSSRSTRSGRSGWRTWPPSAGPR